MRKSKQPNYPAVGWAFGASETTVKNNCTMCAHGMFHLDRDGGAYIACMNDESEYRGEDALGDDDTCEEFEKMKDAYTVWDGPGVFDDPECKDNGEPWADRWRAPPEEGYDQTD